MNTHQPSRFRLTAAITVAAGSLLLGCASPVIAPHVGDPVRVVRAGDQNAPTNQPDVTAPSAGGGRLHYR